MPYEVIKRTPRSEVKGLQMGEKHKHKFMNDAVFRLPDSEAKQARDIRQRFGQDRTDGKEPDVLVARVPDRSTGKSYSIKRVPWHEDEE